MAHHYCYRELEAALPGLTVQRGTEDGQMDTARLEERSSGSREEMGHVGWDHLAHEQGRPNLGRLGV